MSVCLFFDAYQTNLGAALVSTATVMTVGSVTGLPASLSAGQYIPMTLTPASNPGSVYEIVYVTGISGANLTVTRGQENTSALNWSTGDIVFSTNTADTTAPTFASLLTVETIAGNPSFSGGLTVPIGQPQTGIIYDIVGGVSGPIAANQYVLFFKAIRAVNVPANMGNSTAQVNTAFTSAATFVVYHNGVVEASLLFSAGGTIGTFTTSSAFTLAVGDILLIQAPGTADATANTLAITIEATLA